MSKQELERLDDEGLSAWDRHDGEAFASLFADEFVIQDWGMPEPIRNDKAAAREYLEAWTRAFPDMSLKQTNRIVGEDSIAGEVEFTGTNTGPMMMADKEIPPTNKMVTGRGVYMVHVRDGKVVEFRSFPDIAGMMMQLGFIPEM